MPIQVQTHWLYALDGGAVYAEAQIGYQTDEVDPHEGVGQAVDFALAAVFELAEDTQEAQQHLAYIIDQLSIVVRNLRESGA